MKQTNANSRLQVHLCCRLWESSPSINFVTLPSCISHCLYHTWVSYDIPVLVEPLDDANDFFILAESRLASRDPRLPVWESRKRSLKRNRRFYLPDCRFNDKKKLWLIPKKCFDKVRLNKCTTYPQLAIRLVGVVNKRALFGPGILHEPVHVVH